LIAKESVMNSADCETAADIGSGSSSSERQGTNEQRQEADAWLTLMRLLCTVGEKERPAVWLREVLTIADLSGLTPADAQAAIMDAGLIMAPTEGFGGGVVLMGAPEMAALSEGGAGQIPYGPKRLGAGEGGPLARWVEALVLTDLALALVRQSTTAVMHTRAYGLQGGGGEAVRLKLADRLGEVAEAACGLERALSRAERARNN
jgi:hypothetical protein